MPAKFLSVIAFLLCSFLAGAQGYSYIYLQGDKQTPFYVKLEGEMQPRYGKNYCIIPKLETGAVNITILFQQNAYPEQHFVILVPENGSRGFMLTRKGTDFSLYDLQQQFYLSAGNKESDDHLPAPGSKIVAAPVPPPVAEQPAAEKPVTKKEEKTVAVTAPVKQDSSNEPKFIDNIELHNDHQSQEPRTAEVPKPAVTATADNTVATSAPATGNTPPGTAILNSDCPQPIDDDKFQSVYQKASQGTEESRLGYLNQQTGNCMTTLQASTLAKMLDSDPAKYTFLKKMYPHITDQANFASAESIFTDEEWKQYFRQLVHH